MVRMFISTPRGYIDPLNRGKHQQFRHFCIPSKFAIVRPTKRVDCAILRTKFVRRSKRRSKPTTMKWRTSWSPSTLINVKRSPQIRYLHFVDDTDRIRNAIQTSSLVQYRKSCNMTREIFVAAFTTR